MVSKSTVLSLVALLLLSGVGTIAVVDAQTFAHGQHYTGPLMNGATGQWADKATSDAPIGNYPGLWAAAPNGLTDGATKHVESGPLKICQNPDGSPGPCGFYPYATFRLPGVPTQFRADWSKPLALGGYYTFQTVNTGYYSNQWWPMVYYGGAFYNLAALWGYYAIDMGQPDFQYVSSGGDSVCTGCPMGYQFQQNHQFRRGQDFGTYTWTPWCKTYDNIQPAGYAVLYPAVPYCYSGNGWYAYN